ncbi:MAG TPA: hypothetical protein VK627_06575 [Edaphobacter sp.]|nr:hypothetical protein [Edaphobacter sp.]
MGLSVASVEMTALWVGLGMGARQRGGFDVAVRRRRCGCEWPRDGHVAAVRVGYAEAVRLL